MPLRCRRESEDDRHEMTCNETYGRLISLRAADSLDADESAVLERHVKDCAECAEDLRAAITAMHVIRSVDAPVPVAEEWARFEEELWARVEREQITPVAPSRRRPVIYRIAFALTAAAVLVMAVSVLWNALGGTPAGSPPTDDTAGFAGAPVSDPLSHRGQEERAGGISDPGGKRRKTIEERRETLRAAVNRGYLDTCLATISMQKDGVVHVVTESWAPVYLGEREVE